MKTRQCARLMIVNEQQELLLFQYKDEHKAEPFWATAGGELKEGETYREAAKRELYEETGLRNNIGELLKENEDIFAVARSVPALWQEKYYLVNCSSDSKVFAAEWTDEEKTTIQKWKWWSLEAMKSEESQSFKPEWLPKLFDRIVERETAQ
ncbi:NUDIX hydrolase [Aliikangiella coralliicola]|uniref:NUDIX domain-containing protein n=1 Tax=Aliikangiella coralliicola TaxID=2592383 RepID=A0A545UH47_9GAMM|nr:NUDIX domain-containing protein [Aliikangiella coralliicola]TQV88743.1 NUDIX domain-containing protein [Aliikangiella coralliicola]